MAVLGELSSLRDYAKLALIKFIHHDPEPILELGPEISRSAHAGVWQLFSVP